MEDSREGSRQASEKSRGIDISTRDILFECPACGKSLVVDESAEGLTIPCPQCHINVIVPPKQTAALSSPPSPAAAKLGASPAAKTSQPQTAEGGELHERLTALISQLKELQTQRTELTSRMASRVNEVNRDLVMLARLETSQQQIVSELNQVAAKLQTMNAHPNGSPTVLGASVGGGRSRVSFHA